MASAYPCGRKWQWLPEGAPSRMAHNTEIKEAYRGYLPPAWAKPTVERILRRVPDSYLSGLRTIVLTAAGDLSHGRRRRKTRSRKKKVKISEACGLYHEKWRNEPAWIELFVDNIIGAYGAPIRTGFVRDLVIGEVLAHELGHHIHATRAPEFKEGEDVADKWAARLLMPYLMRRYWYFFPLVVWVIRPWRWIKRRFGRRHGSRRA